MIRMSVARLQPHIYAIDLEPDGFRGFIASYVIKGKKAMIIESGPTVTVPSLLRGLHEIGVAQEDVNYVGVSHVHLDHAGGAAKLLSHLPNAKLIVHRRGAPHMIDPEKLWTQATRVLGSVAELYEKPVPVAKERLVAAEDGMTFDLGNRVEVTAVETLGHASHHQSFYEHKGRGVFPGDAAGIYIPEFDVIIPTTPPPFHLETALASIETLRRLGPEGLYYTHFGRAEEALSKLQMHAEQLKLWAEVVAEALTKGETALDKLEKELERRDPALHKVKDYLQTHPILGKGGVLLSVEGFAEYLGRAKSVAL
jgi:glyoxylase-like metal-dependent hydrolase (beta-lactamase superfamily II)